MIRFLAHATAALALLAPLSAQTYSTQPAGDGCNGGQLTVTFTPNGSGAQMEIRADNLHPSTLGGMVFGIVPATIGPVVNAGCFVHTIPIWATQYLTDPSGTQIWQRAWPNSIIGFYYIQLGTLDVDNLEVRLTNCVRAQHL